jgi:signal transduction histidine kinase
MNEKLPTPRSPVPLFRALHPSYYLDALLFWSVFASTNILMLWLLLSEAEHLIRVSTASQVVAISTTTAAAISSNPLFGANSNLELLRSVVENNPEMVSVSVVSLPGEKTPEVLFAYQRPRSRPAAVNSPENLAPMRSALDSGSPTFSSWEFLNSRSLPLLTPRAGELEFVFVPLNPSSGPRGQDLLLAVAFDAPAIQSRLDTLRAASASVVAIAIVVATVLSIFVRIRSGQRLDAAADLHRRAEILRRVAGAADALVARPDPLPVMDQVLRDIRPLMRIEALYLAMGEGLEANGAGTVKILGDGPGYRDALSRSSFQGPEFAEWKLNLSTGPTLAFTEQPKGGIYNPWLQRHSLTALAVIPVLKDKRPCGLLIAESRSPRHHWDDSMLHTLKLTADLFGSSLAQREHSAQMLQASKMEALGLLAGGVAHEFNNLLHIISGNLRRLSFTDPREVDLRDKILASAERGSSIVTQLLRVSRHSDPQLRPACMRDVVQRTLELARPILGRDIQIEFDSTDTPPPVMMEEAQVQQVLLNLMINSRDAMQGRGRIHIGLRKHPGFLHCEVSDSGPGFAPATLDRVFEPFFTTKPPGEGTGLGLSTCKAIMEQHGGSAAASNHPGGGAVVTLCFPLRHPGQAAAGSSPTAVIPGPHNLPRRSILICDDEALCRDVLSDNLHAEGFEVLVAEQGDEAVAKAREKAGELGWIVTDWTMPGLHGEALLRQLQRAAPHAARIVTSGYVIAPETIPEMHAFLQKPFTPDQLMAALREALQRSRRVRA